MDVVLDFVICEYGKIEICFMDGEEGVVFCVFQIIVMLLENVVVEVDGIDVFYLMVGQEIVVLVVLLLGGDVQVV